MFLKPQVFTTKGIYSTPLSTPLSSRPLDRHERDSTQEAGVNYYYLGGDVGSEAGTSSWTTTSPIQPQQTYDTKLYLYTSMYIAVSNMGWVIYTVTHAYPTLPYLLLLYYRNGTRLTIAMTTTTTTTMRIQYHHGVVAAV